MILAVEIKDAKMSSFSSVVFSLWIINEFKKCA